MNAPCIPCLKDTPHLWHDNGTYNESFDIETWAARNAGPRPGGWRAHHGDA